MKFLIPTIYNNQNSFFISLILDRIEQLLEFVHDFRLSSVYSSRLHDCVFLKNFCRFNFRIRYIPMALRRLYRFVFPFVSVGTAKVEIFFELPKTF